MKAFKKTAFLAIALSAAVAGLAGCKSNVKMPVTFVAVTSSTYNAEVSIGDYSYKFKGKVDQKSNKFTLEAITQGKAASGGNQQGGPGGGGMPDFGGGGMPDFGGDQVGNDAGNNEGQDQGGMPDFGGNQGQTPDVGGESQPGEQGSQDQGSQPGVPGESQPGAPEQSSENQGEQQSSPEQGSQEGAPEGQGQMPDFGGEGGMPNFGGDTTPTTPTGNEGAPAGDQQGVPATDQPATSEAVIEEDYSKYNFTINGTYELEAGFGYILHLEDENKTTIHADFDKTEGRHEFYYNVKVGEKSSTVHFQAKDPTFKNQLSKDYKKWDERDSKYIFYAKATGNNSSAATAFMYLHNDGSVVLNSPSGANRSVTIGLTWTEANDVITLKDGEKTYTSINSVNEEHPGKRIDYNSLNYIYSANPEVKWKKFGLNDFEGQPKYAFVGGYETTGVAAQSYEVTLNLYEGGVAKRFVGSWDVEKEGTWSEENGVITVLIDADPYVSVTKDGVTTISYQVEYKMPWGGDPYYADCILTLQTK